MRHSIYLSSSFSLALSLAIGTFSVIASETEGEQALPDPLLPDPLAAGWQGESVCERLHEDESQRILRCTFPPNIGHEKHFHAPHFGYALSGGKMQLIDDKGIREVELKTGSSYTSAGTDWHTVLNVGTTTVQYLIIEPKSVNE